MYFNTRLWAYAAGFRLMLALAVLLGLLASVAGAALILTMPPTAKLLIPNWEDALSPNSSTEPPRPIPAGD